jgi:DNA-binding HxlR family transcriptional regulator
VGLVEADRSTEQGDQGADAEHGTELPAHVDHRTAGGGPVGRQICGGGGFERRSDRCSIARALDVVGTRSALLLMREAFYGTTRFDDFVRRVEIIEAVAATRLKELVAAGLMVRRPYQEAGQRTRFEYHLTELGRDLLPAAFALRQWVIAT